MPKENIIKDKSYAFALDIVRLCKILDEHREYVISKQLLKSGTSIGANVEEAMEAESRKDFVSKLSVSLKEAKETRYWLHLLKDSGSVLDTTKQLSDINEIIALLISILKTTKSRMK